MSSMARTQQRARARKDFLLFYIENREKLMLENSISAIFSALVTKVAMRVRTLVTR